jgi:DNA-binding transcriptional MocR family regulator
MDVERAGRRARRPGSHTLQQLSQAGWPCAMASQIDSERLLEACEARHKVRFAPGPRCLGARHEARLAFSFYQPGELREAAARLAAGLEEALGAVGSSGGGGGRAG